MVIRGNELGRAKRPAEPNKTVHRFANSPGPTRPTGFMGSLHDTEIAHWDHELSLCCNAGFPVCGFCGLSRPQSIRATGKSPEPAGWKACSTGWFMESFPFQKDLLTAHEPWRSGVSAERRWLSFPRIAALYRDAATGASSWEASRESAGFGGMHPAGCSRRVQNSRTRKKERGTLLMELVVAMGILAAVVIPLGLSFSYEQKLCRAYYFQAIAMEVIDGEMEVLRAGEWRAFQNGSQPYRVGATAAKNLPPGRFVLTLNPPLMRLEWIPEKKGKGGSVVREAKVGEVGIMRNP